MVKEVYLLTKMLPEDERYGLTSQMRRSAVSIASNIAEGWGRNSTKNYVQFLRIARGSLLELETQIIICRELSYIENENYNTINNLIVEESKMLNALIKAINK
ncbi:MAG: four helix bundle protein [Vicingus serpentipes]|nr:four helix bundle protein [Vicingus serpentipes]